jgi:hypothetical protein
MRPSHIWREKLSPLLEKMLCTKCSAASTRSKQLAPIQTQLQEHINSNQQQLCNGNQNVAATVGTRHVKPVSTMLRK